VFVGSIVRERVWLSKFEVGGGKAIPVPTIALQLLTQK
jgi:hypothetical protein